MLSLVIINLHNFYSRPDRVKILETYQFLDEDDVFEREPYGVLVSAKNPGKLFSRRI